MKNLICLMILTFAAAFCSCEIKVNEIEDNSGDDFNYQGTGGIAITWDDNSVDEWYKARHDLQRKYKSRLKEFR